MNYVAAPAYLLHDKRYERFKFRAKFLRTKPYFGESPRSFKILNFSGFEILGIVLLRKILSQ